MLGEGPIWSEAEQAVYWLDIKGRRIHRLRPGDGAIDSWVPPFRICSIAPRSSGGFIAGSDRGFTAIDGAFQSFDLIANPEADRPGNRFNDGKVDRAGRFWAGTMDDAEEQASGALYRLDADLAWHRIDDGYQVANGPAFSPDGKVMYHSDSARQTIYRFDVAADGGVSNKAVLAQFGDGDGYPDGMTVDAEGCLWVAFWDGWCLRRLSAEGERLTEIAMPVQRPTSCVFGGPDFDRLFVTSAAIGLDVAEQPLAGGLFTVETGVRGLAARAFAG